jgi:hypothetical protein
MKAFFFPLENLKRLMVNVALPISPAHDSFPLSGGEKSQEIN